MSDLANHNLISFEKGHSAEQTLCEQSGDAPIVYRASSMNAQAIAARAGLGIAFLLTPMGDADPRLERLFVMPSKDTYYLWLLIHADLRQTARVRAFVDFVSEAVLADRSLYEGNPKR